MTLRDLLKNKTLPVKVECEQWLGSGQFVEIFGVNVTHVIGFDEKGFPWEARIAACEHFRWIPHQEPRPKKKMYAYLRESFDTYRMDLVFFVKEKPPEVVSTTFHRAPWLDGDVE